MKKFLFVIALFVATFLFGNVKSIYAQRDSSMVWRGTVDDTIQVVIRNRNARIRHISGRYIDDARFEFNGRAPRENARVRVDKENGRGNVFVVQQPNRRNNYTTIIQINDSKGGSDRYRFVVYWD